MYAYRRHASTQMASLHRAQFYARVWREAAAALGADATVVGREILEITYGDRRTRVFRNETAADDPVTLRLAADKSTVNAILRGHGLPVPDYCEFTLRSIGQAEDFLNRAGVPCVVKAARSTAGGESVTTGIRTRSQLMSASVHGAAYSKELMIEKEIAGSVYRLLFAGGRLIDTVVRHCPTVVGDGKSTVKQLVMMENSRRLRQGQGVQSLLPIDLDMKNSLARARLSLRSIASQGNEIVLKTVTNDNAPEDNASANELLCEPIIEAGRQAVSILRVQLAGVDVVTADPSQPLQATGGAILEVNATPGYHYHYYRRGDGAAVAVPILAMLLGLDREVVAPLVPRHTSAENRLNAGRESG